MFENYCITLVRVRCAHTLLAIRLQGSIEITAGAVLIFWVIALSLHAKKLYAYESRTIRLEIGR